MAGDAVLVGIAQRLSSELRPSCLAARMAGDDFAFTFLEGSRVDGSAIDLEDLHKRLSAPILVGESYIKPSLSIGVCRFADAFRSGENAMINADVALLDAKRSGGGAISLFDPAMRQRRVRRGLIKDVLRAAIRDHKFNVELQPIIDIPSGQLHGFEALARLRHNDISVAPSEFIPIAESSGLIHEVGEQLLSAALSCYSSLRRTANFQGRLGVNVAPAQLRNPRFADALLSDVDAKNVAPEQITVELTETALLETDSNAVAQNLLQLQNRGMRIALDDFGTGFSSLSHLRMFNVEKVKIDRSFITNLHEKQQDQDLVRGLIDLCHSLKISVVAEGVELPAHFELLKAFGCDLSQGYWHAKPMPLDQAVGYVRSFTPQRQSSAA
jgi:predicted signal transduction protein with EAL and GGDEF domain